MLNSPLSRALAAVERFSDEAIAVVPEAPGMELLQYVSHMTGEDIEKLARLYQIFISAGRLDSFEPEVFTGLTGFAEE